MKPKTIKSIFINLTIIILLGIVVIVCLLLKWNLKWYFIFILYFVFRYIGKFLYIYLYGINVSSLQFFDIENDKQKFAINFYLGFSNFNNVIGEFDSNLQINETDLKNIIYNQTTRKMIIPLTRYGQITEIEYNYLDKNFSVKLIP